MTTITLQDVKDAAVYTLRPGQRRPTLAQFAAFINAELGDVYLAEMVKWWGSFDRKIRGSRLRHPGKYQECMKLRVRLRAGGHVDHWGDHSIVLDHNPREAYRDNGEIARWILAELKKAGKLPAEAEVQA